MNIYTFYTPSHSKLLNLFMKYFPESDDDEIIVKKFSQQCRYGSFMEEGWNSTMRKKVEFIIHALSETAENEWFVHSDCDVVLFPNWKKILDEYKDSDVDMLNQDDYYSLCAGFFFCKNNEKTRVLWKNILDTLHKFEHDQYAMNHCIKDSPNLKAINLPKTYFSYGLLGKSAWNGEKFTIPDIMDLKMFHANWTVGVEKKIQLIEEVLRQRNEAVLNK